MQVTFLGFGLIGGSIARAIRSARLKPWGESVIVAWSPSNDGPRTALADGVIDRAAEAPADALAGADLVVIAAPPLETVRLLDDLGGPFRSSLPPGAVVTDVASTKAAIVERAATLGLRFVGGHPMAGRETSGFGASTADLFAGRPWVVVPRPGVAAVTKDGDADVALVEALATACGARPVRMIAAAHDAAVAAVSHLPLIAAAALVEAVAAAADWPGVAELAASGWRDTTRLARGDVVMGAGIAATNAGPLAERVRALRDVLDGWLAELERAGGPDAGRLAARFAAARDRLEEMDGPPAESERGASEAGE